jgi:hypothetical protein
MEEKNPKNETLPSIIIVERRTQRQAELSTTDIMKILRKRAAKCARRVSNGGSIATRPEKDRE